VGGRLPDALPGFSAAGLVNRKEVMGRCPLPLWPLSTVPFRFILWFRPPLLNTACHVVLLRFPALLLNMCRHGSAL
jgi:hypothetical protein